MNWYSSVSTGFKYGKLINHAKERKRGTGCINST